MKLKYSFLLLSSYILLLSSCNSNKAAVSSSQYQNHDNSEYFENYSQTTISKILEEAKQWIGTPYVYGGQTRGKGTDCSGFVMKVYETAGIKLPRNSRAQSSVCTPISTKTLSPGDLVFFTAKKGGSQIGHVGIYVGDGNFIHASSSRGVTISSLSQTYFASHFHSAGRISEMYSKDKNYVKRSNNQTNLSDNDPDLAELEFAKAEAAAMQALDEIIQAHLEEESNATE